MVISLTLASGNSYLGLLVYLSSSLGITAAIRF